LDWTGDNAAKASISANHATGEVRHYAVGNYFPTFYSNNTERMRIDASGTLITKGAAVFNEDGGDNDFRIESNDRTDAFFVNGLTNCVGIRTTGPVLPLSLGDRQGAPLNYINGTSNIISTDTGVFVSAATTNDTNTSLGLQLANDANNVGARSPLIAFSALSTSDGFQHTYATINGIKTGDGADTNWNVGGIDFSTGSGTGATVRMTLDYLGGLTLRPEYLGQFVWNEDSADADFRVESDSNTHMLFVDAEANKVVFGSSSSPNINGSSPRVYDAVVDNGIAIGNGAYTHGFIGTGGTDGNVMIAANSYAANVGSSRYVYISGGTSGGGFGEIASFNRDTGIVFNEESASASYFRVESDSNANMLFVDAGTNTVIVGTNSAANTSGYFQVGSGVSGSVFTSTTAVISNPTTMGSAAGSSYKILQLAQNTGNATAFSFNSIRNNTGSDWTTAALEITMDVDSSNNVRRFQKFAADEGVIFNDSSNDVIDFRVESDTNTHMLFVDAGNNSVAVGTPNVRTGALTVGSTESGVMAVLRTDLGGGNTSGTTGIYMGDAASGVITLAREKTNVNTSDTVIYGEHGFNVQDERIRASRGYINFYAVGVARVQINSAGISSTAIYNNTSGAGTNLGVSSSGEFYRSTSSIKYKRDVQDAPHGLTELMTLRPVTYKSNGNTDGETVYGGLIAEEVHDAGLTEFVQYAEDGSPDALSYANMVSLCVKAIQDQQTMIETLEARITALENA